MLFCTTMHFASGVFAGVFLQVRRKTVSLCYQNAVFREKFHLIEPTTVKIA